MKNLITIIFILLLFSCSDNEPECIERMIEDFKEQHSDRSFTFIYTFEFEGSQYYIFDNGIAFDAIANVVDDQCDEVCNYGGFRPASPLPCDQYQEGINSATQIWP